VDTISSPSFARLLKRSRVAAGLTQEALAERANLSVRTVSDLERGLKTRPHRDTVELLADALGLAPEDRAGFEASVPRGLPLVPPADLTARPPSVLPPTTLTPLIGREREEAQVVSLLRREGTRLLTLTGTGGVGKTRLALQVAATLQEDFADGLVVVSLSSIHDSSLVLSSLARYLGVREAGDQPLLAGVTAHLREKQTLLLLDNFEQVVEAAPLLLELLSRCPRLSLLVTSRVPLHLRGEQELEVPPLPVPDSASVQSLDDVLLYPAVALFLHQARAVKPDFQVSDHDAQVLVEICRKLDGLPLAIELAAARVKVLPLPALLARLEHSLRVLTGGARDLPKRQQTMRNTIAWSHDLLDEGQQRLFHRLAVFAGGCDLAAAEAVCNADEALPFAMLDGLGSLVDQSLLLVEEQEDEPRFRLLETVKEFALDQLLASSEAAAVYREHAHYFLALADEAQQGIRGPEQSGCLDRLEREHDNLRVALRTARETNDVGLGLRLAGTLWPFWRARGHFNEATQWLDGFLTRSEAAGASPAARAHALCAAGALAIEQHGTERALALLRQALVLARQAGDARCSAAALHQLGRVERDRGEYGPAEQVLDESLAIYRELDDRHGVCAALTDRAGVARYQGDFERAAALYQEALALGRAIGDLRRVAEVLARLGGLAGEQGRLSQALRLCEEALALHRQLGDTFGMADALYRLGNTAGDLEDYAHAAARYDESLRLFRTLGDKYGVAYVLVNQGEVAIQRGDLDAAQALLAESLALFREVGDRRCSGVALMLLADVARDQGDYGQARSRYQDCLRLYAALKTRLETVRCLERMARLASVQGEAERAARLHGAAAALREAMSSTMPPADRIRYDPHLAAVRGQLGDEAFSARETEGRAMPLEQAVDYALGANPA
jgi:predicted ATPase/DNA-binding XRE family transcriptional regulator